MVGWLVGWLTAWCWCGCCREVEVEGADMMLKKVVK